MTQWIDEQFYPSPVEEIYYLEGGALSRPVEIKSYYKASTQLIIYLKPSTQERFFWKRDDLVTISLGDSKIYYCKIVGMSINMTEWQIPVQRIHDYEFHLVIV